MKTNAQLIAENKAWAEEILKKVDAKMSKVTLRSREKLPYGVDENGIHIDKRLTNKSWWTNGFWGGLNALLYDYTKNEEYLKTLESSEKLLDEAFRDNMMMLHHDVGFLWHLTSGAKYRITGDEVEFYMSVRASQGFNVIQCVLLTNFPNRYDRYALKDNDFSKFDYDTEGNESYWAGVDECVELAEKYGFTNTVQLVENID